MSMNVAEIQINVQKGLMIEHLILCYVFFSGVQWNVTFCVRLWARGKS
jgi:hypothetical protein